MSDGSADLFNKAEDGTAYWTLSIYVSSDLLAREWHNLAGDPAVAPSSTTQPRHEPKTSLHEAQLKHMPSMALRNAIDPLFNDIADRDFFGASRDFLFAAGLGKNDSKGQPWSSPIDARNALLKERHLTISLPDPIEWTTEGIVFECHLPSTQGRKLEMRRFWFAHSDGALSYHLSFTHHFGANRGPFDVGPLYFLSLLQKLAAPKEFSLSAELMQQVSADAKKPFSVFTRDDHGQPVDLGISPLDGMHVSEEGGVQSVRFWHFVHDLFVKDAATLFDEVLDWQPHESRSPEERHAALSNLLEPRDLIEVPGLKMLRCRYMFHIDDKRMFDRLLPCDPDTGEALTRKRMVRDQCYKPYRMAMEKLMRPGPDKKPTDRVRLGKPRNADLSLPDLPYFPWERLDKTLDYRAVFETEGYKQDIFTDLDNNPIPDFSTFEREILTGNIVQHSEARDLDADFRPINLEPLKKPEKIHVPSYQTGRPDCIEYMFLAGFNQNIID
jgi:hypothetical protein